MIMCIDAQLADRTISKDVLLLSKLRRNLLAVRAQAHEGLLEIKKHSDERVGWKAAALAAAASLALVAVGIYFKHHN